MSKHQVEQREEAYFDDYLNKIHSNFGDKSLSYFEHNLEVIGIVTQFWLSSKK